MLNVGAYCRVSTDSEEQSLSLESQKQYFREKINENPNWKLKEVYYDEGVTGTSTKHREGFNRMIDDALNGELDLIITKEISRFFKKYSRYFILYQTSQRMRSRSKIPN